MIIAFGRFEEAPSVVAEKQQKALDEFMPISKKAQIEIEKRLKSAEMLPSQRGGQCSVENAPVLTISVITWNRSMIVPHFLLHSEITE